MIRKKNNRHTATREEILEAIRTEPLQAGRWITYKPQGGVGEGDDERCPVCVVGAVLRQVGYEDHYIEAEALVSTSAGPVVPDYDENAPTTAERPNVSTLLKRGLYLNALSLKFEMLTTGHVNFGVPKNSAIRTKLAEFVKKNFPKRISWAKCGKYR